MNAFDKTLAPDESILWEGTPSKEVCQKIYKFGIISISLVIFGMACAFIPLSLNLISSFPFDLIFTLIILSFFGFVFLIMVSMFKTIEFDKWKSEQYRITNKRISKTSSFSMFFGMNKTESTQHLPLNELTQYQVSMGIMDNRLKWNTGMISFYVKNSYFPKMFFSHVPDIQKIKEILDSLFIQKRLLELEKTGEPPSFSIDWDQELDSRTAFFTLILKISFTFIITLGFYFLFRFLLGPFEFKFNLIDQIALFYLIFPFDFILVFYFLLTYIKSVSSRFYINNFGIFKENHPDPILDLQHITQFLIKPSIVANLFKKTSATIYFYKDFTGKTSLKIPFTVNYQPLRTQLIDFLLLKKTGVQPTVITAEPTFLRMPPLPLPPELPPEIDLSQPEFHDIYSYLTSDEKVLRYFSPNLSSYKRNVLLSFLPFFSAIIVIILLFSFIFGSAPFQFISLPLLCVFIPLTVCALLPQLQMYLRLRKIAYILTSQQLILKQNKTIEFIPLTRIETISIARRTSDSLFKLDTANLTITVKQSQSTLFPKLPRFYLLYSIDRPDEIAHLIQRLQE